MPKIRIPASSYYLSNSTAFTVSDITNMYTNTDSDNYATFKHIRPVSSIYYLYIRGFNFDLLPVGAIVNSFSIKLKANIDGLITLSTGNYTPKLVNNTIVKTSSCPPITEQVQTLTFINYILEWEDLVSFGELFGVRIRLQRKDRQTVGYLYVYGAEIEVDYTMPDEDIDTSSLWFKANGSWTKASEIYKKIDGQWVKQNELSKVFKENNNYIYKES